MSSSDEEEQERWRAGISKHSHSPEDDYDSPISVDEKSKEKANVSNLHNILSSFLIDFKRERSGERRNERSRQKSSYPRTTSRSTVVVYENNYDAVQEGILSDGAVRLFLVLTTSRLAKAFVQNQRAE